MRGRISATVLPFLLINTVSPCLINTERFRGMKVSDPALARSFEQVVPKGRGVEFFRYNDGLRLRITPDE